MFEEATSKKPDGSVDLRLKVTPKASKNAVGEIIMDAKGAAYLKVYVTTAPEKGKANKAVIALLAKTLGVSKSSLSVISGETDSYKVLRIKP